MRDGLVIGDLDDPSVVHNVHGARGESQWKCLARKPGLSGLWEAVEWACIPVGGISGEHTHTRTEEVYLILSGHGEILLDGQAHPVGPGQVVLTGLGTTHGLLNTGDTPLSWLVIELDTTATAAALRTEGQHPEAADFHPPGTALRAVPGGDPGEVATP